MRAVVGDSHVCTLSAGFNTPQSAVHPIRPTAKGVAMYIGLGTIVVILVVLLLIGVLR